MLLTPAHAPGLRMAGQQFAARADRVASIVGRLDAQLVSMSYSGPAADRFRSSIAERRADMVKVTEVLRMLAEAFARAAASLESGQTGTV